MTILYQNSSFTLKMSPRPSTVSSGKKMLSNILFIFVVLAGSRVVADKPDELPEKLTLPLVSRKGGVQTDLDMYPVESYLANKNVPIWLVESESPSQLKPMPHIMEDIGPFTVYRNTPECSTALYFHKTKQFRGTVVNEFFINDLTYDPITKTTNVSPQTLERATIARHSAETLRNRRPSVMPAGPKRNLGMRSLAAFPETVYIETLFVVHFDLVAIFGSDYDALMRHILSIVNSADLLFSTITRPFIRVNIAGVIFGEKKGSFGEIEKCHQRVMSRDGMKPAINVRCTYDAIDTTLSGYDIPYQSFDLVVFLTSVHISEIPIVPGTKNYMGEVGEILGQTRYSVPRGLYRKSSSQTSMIVISGADDVFTFRFVAHEMAHALGVPHDEGPLWTEDGTCIGNLMRTDSSTCKNCLKFGGTSAMHFERYFGGSLSCIFRNKPRSLQDPPGPRITRETSEQCLCYGYMPVSESSTSVRRTELNCESHLQCLTKEQKIIQTNFYEDGTPCGNNNEKACWNKKCKPVVQDA